jgi:predicted PurR-regulated permease PerM
VQKEQRASERRKYIRLDSVFPVRFRVVSRDGKNIFQYIYDLVPMPDENKKSVLKTLDNTFTAIIRGQFVTSIAQGIVAGFVFWLLGIQLFIFFGLLTVFTSMIPILGAASVWAPISIYLLVVGEVHKGAILFICGFLGISLMDNFLKSFLIGGHSRMPAVLIFLGIIGGISAYGLAGIFAGPVVLAIFFALAKIFHERYIA